jgi:hypothetical protein
MTRQSLAGSLLLLAALTVAVAGDRQPVYRTPQEVFDAAKKALQREDWKGFCGTITDNSLASFVGQLILMPLTYKRIVNTVPEDRQKEILAKFQKEILAKLKPLEEVMARHGLTEETIAKTKDDKPGGKGLEALAQRARKLAARIKDRPAFVADMAAAMKKANPKAAQELPLATDGELKDVKIDGDTAKGEIVTKRGGQEQRESISFRRINGGWKIDEPLGSGVRKIKVRRGTPPPTTK